tara:strand:+ start:36 stop:275 length:240 start_codon:yes stop_codon:yes gene_type:complete
MNSEVKQQLDELRSKLKQQCNSIQEIALKNVVGLMNTDVTVEVSDSGIILKNEELDQEIFIKRDNISTIVRVLNLFIKK